MKTNQLIDTSSSCNPCTKAEGSVKSAEKNEKNRKARHLVVNGGSIIFSSSFIREPLFLSVPPRFPSPLVLYFSINFLAALSWCLITLRNSWLSCKIFR